MNSITDVNFIMKYDFYHKDIPINAIVKIKGIINNCYLVEDISSKERSWVMGYDIEPQNKSDYDWNY